MRSAAAFVFFLAYAIFATRPLAFHPATATLIGADPLSHLWTMNWLTSHAFEPARIFQGNVFHPAAHAVLLTDLSMGTAVLALPLRLFTRDPLVLFNAATILALAFGGWAFHALVHGLTGHRWAGLLTGILAAFSSHQLSHVYHLNLLSIGWLALFLLGLHVAVDRDSWRGAALAGVSFALTAQSSGYYGVAAVCLALVFAAFHWKRLRQPRTLRVVIASAALALVLTLPYIVAFRALSEEQGLRRPPGLSVTMAFHPTRDLTSWSHAYIGIVGGDGELLFPGLLPLIFAGMALARGARHARFYAAAALALVVLSLGPALDLGAFRVPMPYRWLASVPPFDNMRHPFTFASVALFLIAVLAGLGWARLRIAEKPWAGPVIVLLAILETMTDAPRVTPIPPGLPPAYQTLAGLPPGPVLDLPLFSGDSMLWAARYDGPVLNGMSAFAPAQTLVLDRYIRNHWLARAPEDLDTSRPTPYLLARFPVRYVIVPIGRTPGLRPLARAFDRSRLFRFAAEAADGDRIYEVIAPVSPVSP